MARCRDAAIAPGRRATVTAGAAHVCGIDLDGHASCRGDDQDGQLGLPSSTSAAFSCAVCNQQVSCWGDNEFGRLGRATTSPRTDFNAVAVGMPAGHKWVELGSGNVHSCAIAADGTLACWGLGARGQLGDGGHGSSVPVAIAAS